MKNEPEGSQVLCEAFRDYESPYDLYRSTYKYTACGPTIGLVGWMNLYEDNGEGGPHNPGDRRERFACYNDDLRKIRNWLAMRFTHIESISVSSIVEGVDQTTSTRFIPVYDDDGNVRSAEDINDDYWTAINKVNEEAAAIWDETHGCEKCAELMGYVEWQPGETPCRADCPECQGYGVVI